eukprot:gene20417-22430_t
MLAIIGQKWKKSWNIVDNQLRERYPLAAEKLGYAEAITGIKKDHILLGIIGIVILYIVTGYFAALSSDVVSLAYPLYCTVRAIESKTNEAQETWLLYWVVYSTLIFIEYIAGKVLSMLPAYFLVRTAFLIWCMAPWSENGSHIVYYRLIRPFFHHHRVQVETALTAATNEVSNLGKNIIGKVDVDDVKMD